MPFAFALERLPQIILAIAIGAVGGVLARLIGAPMPFLLGSFAASIFFAISDIGILGVRPFLPMPLRNAFVAVIGVMIGGSFHPGILSEFTQIWVLAVSVILFVFAALGYNYLIFRTIGGYDRVTSFYSATPGGLIESIMLGERAGGDPQTLSLQQFCRIALVVTLIPFIFQIWTGQKVGSAAGMTLETKDNIVGVFDWLVFIACAALGLWGGKRIRLPASILIGPLILSGLAHYFGLIEASVPSWAVAIAQIIVGAGMGSRFRGYMPKRILRALVLSFISVGGMLLIGAGLVYAISFVSDLPTTVLFLCFAPGGVTETALIALSLNASPVFVTALHLLRIVITVFIGGFSVRFLKLHAVSGR